MGLVGDRLASFEDEFRGDSSANAGVRLTPDQRPSFYPIYRFAHSQSWLCDIISLRDSSIGISSCPVAV